MHSGSTIAKAPALLPMSSSLNLGSTSLAMLFLWHAVHSGCMLICLCPSCIVQDVAEALRRLPPDVVMARDARLRRAIDLDCKHDHLHGDLLAKQTPNEHYLQVRSGGPCTRVLRKGRLHVVYALMSHSAHIPVVTVAAVVQPLHAAAPPPNRHQSTRHCSLQDQHPWLQLQLPLAQCSAHITSHIVANARCFMTVVLTAEYWSSSHHFSNRWQFSGWQVSSMHSHSRMCVGP